MFIVTEYAALNQMVYFDQISHTYLFQHSSDFGMQNNDEASPSIILDGGGLLVKMLITLEPHGIF